MTCSFPSSTRAQLDKIIFYSGPPSKTSRESASTDAEEWPDIDEILAQADQQEWAAGIEELDFTTGFKSTREGELRLHHPCSCTPANALNYRISKHSRYELCSAGGYLSNGAFCAGQQYSLSIARSWLRRECKRAGCSQRVWQPSAVQER